MGSRAQCPPSTYTCKRVHTDRISRTLNAPPTPTRASGYMRVHPDRVISDFKCPLEHLHVPEGSPQVGSQGRLCPLSTCTCMRVHPDRVIRTINAPRTPTRARGLHEGTSGRGSLLTRIVNAPRAPTRARGRTLLHYRWDHRDVCAPGYLHGHEGTPG